MQSETDPNDTLGWHSRGYLPHRDELSLLQSVTFRLADSLPRQKLKQLEEQLRAVPESERNLRRRTKIEAWLDAGYGSSVLRQPALANVVQNALLKFDGERYRLLCWCVMPNHVHVLLKPTVALGKVVQSWKSFTGRWAKQHAAALDLPIRNDQPFWMREYWDRFIRDERHHRAVVDYIHENPVKAGLCARATDWLWSSARSVSHRGA